MKNKAFKFLEEFGLIATHHLDKFRRQFKRAGLKAEISWRGRQNKSEIYMDQMAIAVQQDIAIVAIFHLNEIADQAIRGTALNEIPLRHTERLWGRRAELSFKVLEKC